MSTPPPTMLTPRRRGAIRGAFTLTELLVSISIVLVLMTLSAGAVSGARASQKINATRSIIARLDSIVQHQLASYDSRAVPLTHPTQSAFSTRADWRSWYIRRYMITCEMPDRWSDVVFMADGTNGLISGSPIQRAYINLPTAVGTDQYAGAECLFMIVMQGGIGDCIDCAGLSSATIGDKDADGFFEFWDAWRNPIGYILWPAGLELPIGSGIAFFNGSRALDTAFPGMGAPRPALGMRPLIYSGGPDGRDPNGDGGFGFNTNTAISNLSAGAGPPGRDCGNPAAAPTNTNATASDPQAVRDNITNFDTEARP